MSRSEEKVHATKEVKCTVQLSEAHDEYMFKRYRDTDGIASISVYKNGRQVLLFSDVPKVKERYEQEAKDFANTLLAMVNEPCIISAKTRGHGY